MANYKRKDIESYKRFMDYYNRSNVPMPHNPKERKIKTPRDINIIMKETELLRVYGYKELKGCLISLEDLLADVKTPESEGLLESQASRVHSVFSRLFYEAKDGLEAYSKEMAAVEKEQEKDFAASLIEEKFDKEREAEGIKIIPVETVREAVGLPFEKVKTHLLSEYPCIDYRNGTISN